MRATVFTALAALAGGLSAWAADAPRTERFDYLVRQDLFAGFGGDEEALARGLKTCEDALAKNPKHAPALVWRGAARAFQASLKFRDNKPAEAMPLWTAGLKDMDDAVALEPNNIGVRIPRAVVLLPAARATPPAVSKPLLARALD